MIAENLEIIHGNIAAAAAKAGRRADEVELLAVSKTFPPEAVAEAYAAGQRAFAENRVQELLSKAPLVPSGVVWHIIGHLQSNKIRKALQHCRILHSVDSVELARDIERIADEAGVYVDAYLQVNVAEDGRKHGFTTASVPALMDELLSLKRVSVVGLMTIPALDPVPENSRRHFAALRQLRDRLQAQTGTPLPGLSMGMSGDYHIAVEEGATIVRVGSAIFGGRAART